MADRFTRAFGSFLRRIVDMGDGTFSEQVVSKPPSNMVSGDRLKVALDEPIDVTLPAVLINANRLKVEVDDPIDVVLPSAMVNANRLKVEVDDPIDINLPNALITSGGINGTNPRLRVDIGQTGFFAGREFRTFREFNIAAGQTLVLKIVVPINAILAEQSMELDSGSIRITNATGGTPGGSFSETLPIIGKNNMTERPTPLYTSQIVFTAGGTHTGGFIFDIHRAVAASATAQQSTVGRTVGDERGIAAATYYVRYENIGSGAATGTFWFIWEERV